MNLDEPGSVNEKFLKSLVYRGLIMIMIEAVEAMMLRCGLGIWKVQCIFFFCYEFFKFFFLG